MGMDILIWVVAAALLAGVAMFVVMARGRRALQEQLAAAQSAQAVAESRLSDLGRQHDELASAHRALIDQHRVVTAERERLQTSLEKVREDLAREVASGAALRESLQKSTDRISQLDSDYRVAKSQSESLAIRVAQLDEAMRAATEENRKQGEAIAHLKAADAALRTERDGLQARLTEQKTWVEEQTRAFEERITNITGQLLEDKTQKFTELNRTQMDGVVAPFKEQLGEFRQRVDSIYAADTQERGQLREQILQLTSLNQAVSQPAQALTRALTISSKSTGDWGEMVLQKILEDSGLRENQEYKLQHHGGGRRRVAATPRCRHFSAGGATAGDRR